MTTFITPVLTPTMREMSPDEQPREKLFHRGPASLSNAEILAILLGSGTRGRPAIEVAREILRSAGNDLHLLARYGVADYCRFSGVGKVRAAQLIAATELGRRREVAKLGRRTKLPDSTTCFQYLRPLLGDLDHEEFYLLCLNRANELLGSHRISQGGTTGTVADAKTIFRTALTHGSVTSLVIAHNHPSGQCFPSEADRVLTRKLNLAARNLDLHLLDHLIVAGNRYYSFADEGSLT